MLWMVVFDVAENVALFLSIFVYVYVLAMFAYIILSWFRVPYSLQPVQRFLYDVCEPYLRLFRRILPPIGGAIDLSPIVSVLVLVGLDQLVVRLLDQLH